jgi:16S rRNA (cytosine1402-N4)-methyltransferase
VATVNGVLMDLGVSSPQIDDGRRGFSFRFDAPLDMRMDTTRGITAAQWLASAEEDEIKEVIKTYGEERFARKIAAAIVAQRELAPIQTTRELALLVGQNVRTREPGQDPATRTFQAIRIFVNRELDELKAVLPQAARHLAEDGRLAIISFHSLEDRIVKQYLRDASSVEKLPSWVMVRAEDMAQPPLETVGKPCAPAKKKCVKTPVRAAPSCVLPNAPLRRGARGMHEPSVRDSSGACGGVRLVGGHLAARIAQAVQRPAERAEIRPAAGSGVWPAATGAKHLGCPCGD